MTTERRKTIIRVNHSAQPYFMVARSVAQNEAISYEALGLLCYLLSKPNDWEIQPKALAREHCGRDKAYRLIDELLKARHIERTAVKNELGRIMRVEYVVYESPLPEKPDTAKPDMDKPDTEKAYITEYRETQSTEGERTEAPPPAEPMKITTLRNDTLAAVNGWALVAEYADVTGIAAETVWEAIKVPKVAAGLSRAGITTEDVRDFMTEMKRTPERYNGYRFNYLAEDLPRWKQNRAEKPALVVVSVTDEQRAAREKQMDAEREAYRIREGLA
jgi:hypothetical protein